MPPTQYPTPFNASYPTEPAGPQYLILFDHIPEFAGVMVQEFKDHGASYGLSGAQQVLRWSIHYNGLSVAQIATIDTHYISARGAYDGFLFRHPRTNVLYSDVHYDTFTKPEHKRYWIQERRIILIKRPV